MPQRFTCPRGHQWEGSGVARSEDGVPICPVCRLADSTPPPPPPTLVPEQRPGQGGVQGSPRGGGAEPATGPPQDAPVIPGYEILAELGRGGMGRVFKARQVRLDRVVAIKVIRPDRLAHPEELYVRRTAVTDAGARELRQALPQVKVVR